MKKTNPDEYRFGIHDLWFYPLSKQELAKMKKEHLSMKEFVCPRCYCYSQLSGDCAANLEPKCFGRSDRKIGFFSF
jgi:hypothetical protein